ncbi:MAG: fla cluster protein FlaF [Halodesulfurarchaeum sp.]
MGFSVSAGTAIVAIAALASVGMLYTAGYNGYEQVQDAQQLKQERALAAENTELAITNVTHDNSTDPHTITVTANNTGTTSLAVTATDLLLEGEYAEVETTTVGTDSGTIEADTDGTDLFQPGESLTFTVRENYSAGFSASVVTEHGIADREVS